MDRGQIFTFARAILIRRSGHAIARRWHADDIAIARVGGGSVPRTSPQRSIEGGKSLPIFPCDRVDVLSILKICVR